jgi:DedD protein
MEPRVRERLVGALVLVAIVVLVVPAVLTGRGSARDDAPVQPTRREILPAGDGAPVEEEEILVPEPVADAPATEPAVKAPPPTEPDAERAPPEAASTSPPKPTKPAAPAPAAAPPPPASLPPAPGGDAQAPAWAVQLGAFSNRSKAEQLVADLRKRGYAAFLLEYRAGGQVLYRVRVGPEQDRERAREIAARLAKDGFEPVVARHP